MLGKGTIDAVFILTRLHEEYLDKEKKLYMCFVDLEKAFDRVLRWIFLVFTHVTYCLTTFAICHVGVAFV